MMWLNCMCHKLGLLFGEWRKKAGEVMVICVKCMKITKWVNNHSELLQSFRDNVEKVFEDRRRWNVTLCTPGDTRMATIFKLAHETKHLWPVLKALVNDGDYDATAQRLCVDYNKQCKDESKKIHKRDWMGSTLMK